MSCNDCPHNGTNCWLRYYKDFLEFGEEGGKMEWICPQCETPHLISNLDFQCENCGFWYECQGIL